jgi:hypothetical protein
MNFHAKQFWNQIIFIQVMSYSISGTRRTIATAFQNIWKHLYWTLGVDSYYETYWKKNRRNIATPSAYQEPIYHRLKIKQYQESLRWVLFLLSMHSNLSCLAPVCRITMRKKLYDNLRLLFVKILLHTRRKNIHVFFIHLVKSPLSILYSRIMQFLV